MLDDVAEDLSIEYPSSDGEPMAENDWQFVALTYTVSARRVYFRQRTDVYAAGDMFVYYRRNDPAACVAPDVYVVIGANGNQRRHSRRNLGIVRLAGGQSPRFRAGSSIAQHLAAR